MAVLNYSSELCELLYAAPKYVASQIKWKGTSDGVFIFQAKVLTTEGLGLDLTGRWVRRRIGVHEQPRWGFDLKYHGHTVRSYDMATYHKNPGIVGKIKGPHKHKFSSAKIDRLAYIPEIAIPTDNANDALLAFLLECNIELKTNYQRFMFL